MGTFTKPITRVRMADSGGIKLLLEESPIKRAETVDDKNDVRLPEGAYRIVMHCRNARGTMKTEKTIPNR
jgi:hypothetical protein